MKHLFKCFDIQIDVETDISQMNIRSFLKNKCGIIERIAIELLILNCFNRIKHILIKLLVNN